MANGYIRQSSSEIQTGNIINASDSNNEYNALQTAFDATVGHTHDGTTGGGAPIGTTSLANNSVTYPIIQQMSTAKLLGNSSNATANVSEISIGTGIVFNGTILQASSAVNNTLKGNISGATAVPIDLTMIQVAAALPAFIASGASHAQGLVPDPGVTVGTTKYLREDATWFVPAAPGATSNVLYNNAGVVAGNGGFTYDGASGISLASSGAANSGFIELIDKSSGHYTALIATPGTSVNHTFALPTTYGVAGNPMIANGANGSLAWASGVIISSGTVQLGDAISITGSLLITAGGATTITLTAPTITSSYNLNLPATAGLSGQSLLSAGGGSSSMTWGLGGATTPQGRLTLTSGSPVMNTTTNNVSTIYYAAYWGGQVPVYNGTSWVSLAIGSNEISTSLGSSTVLSGNLYDLFAINVTGTLVIAYGPAWSSSTSGSSSRGTGSGTTQLTKTNGLLTNANAITVFSGASGGTSHSLAANTGTYLGTFYATANGQTSVDFFSNSGGPITIGLYNAYNRENLIATVLYSTPQTPGSGANAWAQFESVSIFWVDGLATAAIKVDTSAIIATSSTSVIGSIGTSLNSTSATPTFAPSTRGLGAITAGTQVSGPDYALPSLGYNFFSGMVFLSSNSQVQFFNFLLQIHGSY